MVGFMEFLCLGDCLFEVILCQDEDQHIWCFDASGSYLEKYVYQVFFKSSATVFLQYLGGT
jgi:hypothetical protein